jgi:hypothetical protein
MLSRQNCPCCPCFQFILCSKNPGWSTRYSIKTSNRGTTIFPKGIIKLMQYSYGSYEGDFILPAAVTSPTVRTGWYRIRRLSFYRIWLAAIASLKAESALSRTARSSRLVISWPLRKAPPRARCWPPTPAGALCTATARPTQGWH